ncbi:PREDICTED: galectin-9-like [Priapulus caudatus]|uniref:Galectin n=1 Tax=Priapulus caudatus TaxID=37621 RepID=A0ABM1F3K3_PRICU|nr:PREDICTED: galectin-9-like [Priapulus caudatus]
MSFEVPHVSELLGGGLTPGKLVYIQGVPPPGSSRFAINFMSGQDGDIGFHFNPRFEGGNVVCNSCVNGEWGAEESHEGLPPNLAVGEPFEVVIKGEPECFKVAVNGAHYIDFCHRTPVDTIKTVQIDGEVTLTGIFEKMDVNGTVSYTSTIPGGLAPGKTVVIRGKVPDTSPRFALNLQAGPPGTPQPDIALHFNPRFNERTVVRNTLQAGAWGAEERGGVPPNLVPGEAFEIAILVEENCYKVTVNSVTYTEFAHRIPVDSINTVEIGGDVLITAISC